VTKRYGLTDWLSSDARSAREFFHAVGDNRSELHHLLAQFRVFRNVAFNAIAIGLQLSPQCLKLTDEIVNFAQRSL
jgi:hypothetical protein